MIKLNKSKNLISIYIKLTVNRLKVKRNNQLLLRHP